MIAVAIPARPAKPLPLTQVELPIKFNGGTMSLTVDVYGTRVVDDNTGAPGIEDMRLESGGEDVTELLEPLADEIASYVANET